MGSTPHYAKGTIASGTGQDCRNCCPSRTQTVNAGTNVAKLTCTTSVTRAGTATCTVTPSGITVSNWKFTDGTNTVTRTTNTGSLTWSATMVTSGTVSVTPAGASSLTASISVNSRTQFAFTAVNPTQVLANSITCYGGMTQTLPSPPVNNGLVGFSCADMAYSFTFATISDGGPNNGYEYVTSASNASGGLPTKYEYIVVSDAFNTSSSFYTHQCGNYSASNSLGFIAGSQLKQNIFDHEQGSVLSHWTEYRDAQNNNSNNVGTVLEAAIGAPGSSGSTFAQQQSDAAMQRIAQAVMQEPCGGTVNKDSSQSCAYCGIINFTPYQSCGSSQPAPYCQ